MLIPRCWAKADGEYKAPDNRQFKFSVWGWGADDASAKREAASRLQRLLERVRRGDQLNRAYGYGNRPLREEILQILGDGAPMEPTAILTRNRYGAVVLNTARLMFLDVDIPAEGMFKHLRRLTFTLNMSLKMSCSATKRKPTGSSASFTTKSLKMRSRMTISCCTTRHSRAC